MRSKGGCGNMLDVSSYLYERVGPSVGQLVRRSACHTFMKINENCPFQQIKARRSLGNHAIIKSFQQARGRIFV